MRSPANLACRRPGPDGSRYSSRLSASIPENTRIISYFAAAVSHSKKPDDRDSHKAVPIAVTPHRLIAAEVPLELSLYKSESNRWCILIESFIRQLQSAASICLNLDLSAANSCGCVNCQLSLSIAASIPNASALCAINHSLSDLILIPSASQNRKEKSKNNPLDKTQNESSNDSTD